MKQLQEFIGEDGLFGEETHEQFLYAQYDVYFQLKAIHYTDEEIAKQFYCSVIDLKKLLANFE